MHIVLFHQHLPFSTTAGSSVAIFFLFSTCIVVAFVSSFIVTFIIPAKFTRKPWEEL